MRRDHKGGDEYGRSYGFNPRASMRRDVMGAQRRARATSFNPRASMRRDSKFRQSSTVKFHSFFQIPAFLKDPSSIKEQRLRNLVIESGANHALLSLPLVVRTSVSCYAKAPEGSAFAQTSEDLVVAVTGGRSCNCTRSPCFRCSQCPAYRSCCSRSSRQPNSRRKGPAGRAAD